jgi:hypothetical protein
LFKEFVENVRRLIGYWKSPAKQLQSSKGHDFTLTWYPAKQHSLTFSGKDGEIVKEFLVNTLNKDPIDRTIIQQQNYIILSTMLAERIANHQLKHQL